MRAKCQRFVIFGFKLFDQFGPQHASGTQLGNFHKVIHANGPEKG
jgi:hypothetical protein